MSDDNSFYAYRIYCEQQNTEYIRQEAAQAELNYWKQRMEKEGFLNTRDTEKT